MSLTISFGEVLDATDKLSFANQQRLVKSGNVWKPNL